MTRLFISFVFALLLGGYGMCTAEARAAGSDVATLIVSHTTKMCAQCQLGPDAALIQVRTPSGKIVWSSIAGQEPERLPLQAGHWQITYFCPGIADFEGHQEIVVEPGISYIVSCGKLPNYPLKLRRTSGAPNHSFEADGYAAAQLKR